ncbi:oxygenase [Streptomyces humidus]|uniref:Oxygenase n=1 Tax=Streptomyces humidus TaxID=52259 RepID=A0A918G024_9ACTN|nr:FAD-dependent oxidoreductase [Streptomyces humidus]GGS05507.1 oxygenase [Streptomyces humidus]
MGSWKTPDTEVLVTGAGPVGLTAAHELARRGVRVRLVDRADGPAVTSRATATHARALEVYHQMGVLEDVLRLGRRVDKFTMHQRGRARARLDADFSRLPTRFPFTLQIDQVLTEQVLRERVRDLGVKIEWGVGLEEAGSHDDHVSVTLRHADGTAEKLSVPWLVGADGAHSTVRRALGIELVGENNETWLTADAALDTDLPPDSLHWMHTGKGTILMVPFPEPGKWRLLDTVDVDHADRPDVIAERFARKITRGTGRTTTVRELTWVSVFTIRQRMIRTMRSGRCFLAGDAAHVHSPASGQGMNTGVQDAHNLAWKLAAVVHGRADDALLDSYSAERVPVGEKLLMSTKTATGLVALQNAAAPVLLPVGLGFLDAVRPVRRQVERKVQRVMSGLALDYPDSPLTVAAERSDGIAPGARVGCTAETARASAGWRALCEEFTDPRWTLLVRPTASAGHGDLERIGRRFGAEVSLRTVGGGDPAPGPHPLADPDGALWRALGAPDPGYALVRPDGYLAAKGELAAADELERLLRRVHLVPGDGGRGDA